MATHLHGYHGSSKDQCIYCGSGESEDLYCPARTARELENQARVERLKQLHDEVASRLTQEEYDALTAASTYNWRKPT